MFDVIILTSLWCMGLFISGSDPYILFPVRKWIAERLGGVYAIDNGEGFFSFEGMVGEFWKPFWGCPTCMASIWSVPFVWMFGEWQYLPIVIVCSAGLNFIIFNNLVAKWLKD